MNQQNFDEKMASVLARLVSLRDRSLTGGTPVPQADEVLTELSNALEELHVADEELHEKNQQLVAAARRYQELFEFAPDAYVETDLNGVIREANRAATLLLGLPVMELIGRPLIVFVAAAWRRQTLQLINDVAKGHEIRDRDMLIQPPHLLPTACAVSAMPLRDAGNDVIGLHWLIRDISERKRSEQALQSDNVRLDQAVSERTADLEQANVRLRSLMHTVVTVQEGERRRISRELHDEAGQALTALKMNLEVMREDIPSELPQIKARLGEMVSLIAETLEEIRALAQALRPPSLDAADINTVLDGLCREFARGGQLAIYYQGEPMPSLPEAESVTLYRFLQEALTNVAKHAHATQIQVVLSSDAEEVTLSVQDNGRGFDANAKPAMLQSSNMGLIGMQERLKTVNGWLEIDSEPEKGTRLMARIPHKEAE